MKKIALGLVLLSIILLVGCGGSGSGTITVSKTSFAPGEEFNVDYTVGKKMNSPWVAVFDPATKHDAVSAWSGGYDSWDYADDESGNGKVELYAPYDAGKYELRLYSGGSEDDKELQVVEIEVVGAP